MKPQSITSLPPSPDQERRARMLRYTIAMTIRVGCIFAMLFVQGWWLAVFAAGAIFLPYVAVVLANAQGSGRAGQVAAPDRQLPAAPTPPASPTGPEASGDPEPGETR
jgi:predicted tellurium resistance membrane protein TerC